MSLSLQLKIDIQNVRSNKVNSLQRYYIALNYRIMHKVIQPSHSCASKLAMKIQLRDVVTSGKAPTSPPCGECCSAVASREAYLSTRVWSSCGRQCWRSGWCCRCGWCGCWLGGGRPVVGLVEGVGWLNPVGRHDNRPATHEDLKSLLLPWEDLVRAAVWRFRWRRIPS
jgi:hypothetical protein